MRRLLLFRVVVCWGTLTPFRLHAPVVEKPNAIHVEEIKSEQAAKRLEEVKPGAAARPAAAIYYPIKSEDLAAPVDPKTFGDERDEKVIKKSRFMVDDAEEAGEVLGELNPNGVNLEEEEQKRKMLSTMNQMAKSYKKGSTTPEKKSEGFSV
eukprot:Trichotokara_eunicae@DN5473_c0_g1_i1.p1